jgi:hypothetical protein
MKSIVEVEIHKAQKEAAELYADPHNNLKWMRSVARYEPLSGEQGMPGSTYRLVPKEGDMIFVVTVVERNLPDDSNCTSSRPMLMWKLEEYLAVSPPQGQN